MHGPRYVVRVDPELRVLDVRVCFGASVPRRLIIGRSSAASAILRADVHNPGEPSRRLSRRGRSVLVEGAKPGACVTYAVDLARARGQWPWTGVRRAAAVELDSARWLLRPSPMPDGTFGVLSFDLPPGMQAATSWPRIRNGYRVERDTFRHLSHTVLGRFSMDSIQVGDSELRVARLPGSLALDEVELHGWIRRVAAGVVPIHGRFPAPRALIVIVPVGPGPDPVAFGNVGRGGGASVKLLLRENATLAGLEQDWVAVHELSHLTMPFVDRSDAWLSEGVATYYQEVLRARMGLRSPLAAWRALDDGFRRGRARGTGRTLRRESDLMYDTRAFQRVYWGGTAIALLIDVALRRRGGAVGTLDEALRVLWECCREESSGADLMDQLDGALGDTIAGPVARDHLRSVELPSLDRLYAFLGLRRGPDGLLVLDSDADGASIRDAIMEGTHASDGTVSIRPGPARPTERAPARPGPEVP